MSKREIRLEDLKENEFYTYDDIMIYEDDQRMNFVWGLWFDVDKYFGTNVNEDDDAWINFYTDWFADGHIEATIVINRSTHCEERKWILLPNETQMIRNKMTKAVKEFGYNSLAEYYTDNICN